MLLPGKVISATDTVLLCEKNWIAQECWDVAVHEDAAADVSDVCVVLSPDGPVSTGMGISSNLSIITGWLHFPARNLLAIF
jgi:hypothetical protein